MWKCQNSWEKFTQGMNPGTFLSGRAPPRPQSLISSPIFRRLLGDFGKWVMTHVEQGAVHAEAVRAQHGLQVVQAGVNGVQVLVQLIPAGNADTEPLSGTTPGTTTPGTTTAMGMLGTMGITGITTGTAGLGKPPGQHSQEQQHRERHWE